MPLRAALATVAALAATFVALLVAAPLATAATPTPTPVPSPTTLLPTLVPPLPTLVPGGKPSIAQLCAATSVDQVDDLLRDLDRTDLVDELAPLASLTVPDRDTPELDASVQLSDVRKRLNCADPTSSTTTAAVPPLYADCAAAIAAGVAPITEGQPGYRAGLDADHDGVACEAGDPATAAVVTEVPSTSHGVDTGWAA